MHNLGRIQLFNKSNVKTQGHEHRKFLRYMTVALQIASLPGMSIALFPDNKAKSSVTFSRHEEDTVWLFFQCICKNPVNISNTHPKAAYIFLSSGHQTG